MSIGPLQSEENKATDRFESAKLALKKAAVSYFADPIHYLFYITLLLTVISLVLNHHLPIQFYILLLILGVAKLYQHQKQEEMRNQK